MGDKGGFRAGRSREIPRPRQVGRPPPLARFRTVRRLTRLRYRIQPQPLGAHRRRSACSCPRAAPHSSATSSWSMAPLESVCPAWSRIRKTPSSGCAGSRLTFIARDVPAFGFRRYDLVEGDEEHEDQESGNEPCIENEHYLVRFDLARAG